MLLFQGHVTSLRSKRFPLEFVEMLATQAAMLHVFVQIILPQKGLGISRYSIGACFRKIIFISIY